MTGAQIEQELSQYGEGYTRSLLLALKDALAEVERLKASCGRMVNALVGIRESLEHPDKMLDFNPCEAPALAEQGYKEADAWLASRDAMMRASGAAEILNEWAEAQDYGRPEHSSELRKRADAKRKEAGE